MERILFDAKGRPIAYIADDGERSIYLWKGHAVAYIDDQLNCYGWNGRHLGWIEDGILFDRQGLRVGFLSTNSQRTSGTEPAKPAKFAKNAKQAKALPHARPARSTRISSQSLNDFLKAGAVGSV